MSSTSSSCVQPGPGRASSGPTQRACPSAEYQTGIRCPHHSWRLMHQSCMSSTQSKYRPASCGGWICTRPSRTASPAALASGPTLTNHCRDNRGSTVVAHRPQWPTACRYGLVSFITRPSARKAASTAGRASNRSRPWNGPAAVITPRSSMIVRDGRSCRRPISKSSGSWAGVTFTAPVPNPGSTCGSATTGIFRPVSGSSMARPTRCAYLASSGCTATPVSPSMVSTRVVATTTAASPSPYLILTSSPSSSVWSTSMSERAVMHRGHQLMIRSAR